TGIDLPRSLPSHLGKLGLELEQLMRGFLWCQCEMKKGRAKVASPYGSNGFIAISSMGALFGRFLFGVMAIKLPLGLKIGVCWALLRILFLTVTFMVLAIIGRLKLKILLLMILGVGWMFWMSKYSDLGTIGVLYLFDASDKLVWKDLSNVDVGFSVATVWECIRSRSDEVEWYHVVWFSQQIPRHAIHLWLVIKRKLKTQDKLRQWDVWDHLKRLTGIPNIPSGLDAIVDFLSPMAKPRSARSVWDHLKRLTGIPNIPSDLDAIVDFLSPMAKPRSARSVIWKLVFAASCYFIWQERNKRLFMKKKRSQYHVIDVIKSTVRLKLLSCRFKRTKHVQMLRAGLKEECSPIDVLFFPSPSGNPLDLNNLPEDLASDHDKQPLHNSSPAAAPVGT
nr:hypothetical protein [Tanacetum cinerariifolium]